MIRPTTHLVLLLGAIGCLGGYEDISGILGLRGDIFCLAGLDLFRLFGAGGFGVYSYITLELMDCLLRP